MAGAGALPQRCPWSRQGPALPRQRPAQPGLGKLLLPQVAASLVLVGRAERGCPLSSEGVRCWCAQPVPRLTRSCPGASDKPGFAPFPPPVGTTKKKPTPISACLLLCCPYSFCKLNTEDVFYPARYLAMGHYGHLRVDVHSQNCGSLRCAWGLLGMVVGTQMGVHRCFSRCSRPHQSVSSCSHGYRARTYQ